MITTEQIQELIKKYQHKIDMAEKRIDTETDKPTSQIDDVYLQSQLVTKRLSENIIADLKSLIKL